MKDVFYKNTDFFKGQIYPDEGAGQNEEQPDERVGQRITQKQRKTAEGEEINNGAQHREDIHKHPLPALSQRQPQQEKRQSRDQPE
jgi:gamma-glutamylcysteine synthetase